MRSIHKIKYLKRVLLGTPGGFTLMEVMIAMAIFAIGILGVATMQISSTNGNTGARKRSEASEIAQGQMESFMNISYVDITIGTTVTTVTIGPTGNTTPYTVTETTVSVPAGGPPIGIQLLVVVNDPRGNQVNSLSITRYDGI